MMSNEEVKIRNLQQEVERLKAEVQELSAPTWTSTGGARSESSSSRW